MNPPDNLPNVTSGGKFLHKVSSFLAPMALVLNCAPALAQESAPAVDFAQTNSSASCTIIKALTPVSVEISTALGSKTSKSGETFPIRLVAPIIIDGKEVVPAGATGIGEVVHAKRAGGMGAAGELVLAARYLEVDGRQLRLRSLRLPTTGKSKIGTVDAIAVASAASPIPVSIVGFFITGGQIVVQQGTIAEAKVAEDLRLNAPDKLTSGEKSPVCPDVPSQSPRGNQE